MIACAALALGCTGSPAGEPLLIDFVADRDAALAGEQVAWTVFVELPDDLPANASVVLVEGDFLPLDLVSMQAQWLTPLVLRQWATPLLYGGAVVNAHAARVDPLSSFAPDRLPVFAFSTVITDAGHNWYDFRGRVLVFAPPGVLLVYARDPSQAATPDGVIRVRTDRVNHPSCDHADLVAPWFVHTPTDITAFVDLFSVGSPIADVAAPWGVLDPEDVRAFFEIYTGSCAFDWE